jgi:phage replication-related protein YjqB (UPF0714/DUF867 family)
MIIAASSFALAVETETPASDRVIQFLTNVHTGVVLNDADWLTTEARSAGKLSAHGGLKRVVQQTTEFARTFNGVKSVAILEVAELRDTRRIRAQVTFFDEKRRKASPSAAEREDMIWVFLAKKEDGKWKLQF